MLRHRRLRQLQTRPQRPSRALALAQLRKHPPTHRVRQTTEHVRTIRITEYWPDHKIIIKLITIYVKLDAARRVSVWTGGIVQPMPSLWRDRELIAVAARALAKINIKLILILWSGCLERVGL